MTNTALNISLQGMHSMIDDFGGRSLRCWLSSYYHRIRMKSAKCPACGATMREIRVPSMHHQADCPVAGRSRCASPMFLPKNVPTAANDTFSQRRLERWIKPSSKSTVCAAAEGPLDLERHHR